MRAARALVIFVVAVALLAGCKTGHVPSSAATSAEDDAIATASPTETPSPEATAEQDPGSEPADSVRIGPVPPIYHPDSSYAPPKFVFGGDCNAVFTEAQLASVLGAPLEFRAGSHYPSMNELDEVGGISCLWYADEGGPWLIVDVFPVGAASYKKSATCDGTGFEHGCDFEATRNGVQLSGGLMADGDAQPITSAMQKQLINFFLDHATPAMSAPLPPLPSGSWDPAVDCAAVVAGGGFGKGTKGYGIGGLGAYFSAGLDALIAAHSTPSMESFPGVCAIYDGSDQDEFQVYAGTRWSGERQLDGTAAGRLVVTGVDEVWTQTFSDQTIADVFDGPNWIKIYADPSVDVGQLAKQLVKALNATAIP